MESALNWKWFSEWTNKKMVTKIMKSPNLVGRLNYNKVILLSLYTAVLYIWTVHDSLYHHMSTKSHHMYLSNNCIINVVSVSYLSTSWSITFHTTLAQVGQSSLQPSLRHQLPKISWKYIVIQHNDLLPW